MNSTTKNIIIILVIVVIAIVSYTIFFKKDIVPVGNLSSSTGVNVDASPSYGDSGVGDQFLTTLLNLQSIRLDDSLFAGPAFQNLKDFTIVLVQSSSEGRDNPFAPLSSAKSSTGASSTLLTIPASSGNELLGE